MRRVLLLLLAGGSVFAQMPKGIYSWWNKPEIRRDLNLTNQQQRQIRATVVEYRPHLLEVRAEVAKAEADLQAQFDNDPVDPNKANQAIDRLIAARSDLTRTLSQMSLKLRAVLNAQQWRELQRRRSGRDDEPPTESPTQK